jgi:hypothetical protein
MGENWRRECDSGLDRIKSRRAARRQIARQHGRRSENGKYRGERDRVEWLMPNRSADGAAEADRHSDAR